MYQVKSSVPGCPAKMQKWEEWSPAVLAELNSETEESSGSHPDNQSFPEKAEQAGPEMCVLDHVNICGHVPVEICTVLTTQI